MHTIEADYLVIGAGAPSGMAFIDTLVSETEAAASALGVLRPSLAAPGPQV
jgi:hypothetical protein